MSKRKRSINSVIHQQFLGQLSEEDRIRLDSWLESSCEHRETYDHFLKDTGFVERYHAYREIDEARAWEQFQKTHFAERRIRWNRIVHYAAMLMLPVIGVAIWLWTLQAGGDKPDISHETRVTMIRSEQLGKQKATLVLTNGRKVELHSVSSMPIQNALAQSVSVPIEAKEEEAPVDNNNQLATHRDSEFWMTLEDGTHVHLNYNTTLKYPSHFSSTTRTVYLDGEAYFEVAKDSNKRPFLVITKDGVVRQYGTSFNVNTQSVLETKVVLVEGSISVISNKGKECRLKPGELAVLHGKTAETSISKVDIEPYVAWHKGRFVFDDCSLETLMNVLSDWYGKEVIFESEDIRNMRFTGDMDRYESIIPIIKAIQRVTGLEVEVTEKNILLKSYNTNH